MSKMPIIGFGQHKLLFCVKTRCNSLKIFSLLLFTYHEILCQSLMRELQLGSNHSKWEGPVVSVLMGHYFHYEIPTHHFKCNLTRIRVTEVYARELPSWMEYHEKSQLIQGLPQETHIGVYEIILVGISNTLDHQEKVCNTFTKVIKVVDNPNSLAENLQNWLDKRKTITLDTKSHDLTSCLFHSSVAVITFNFEVDILNPFNGLEIANSFEKEFGYSKELIQICNNNNSLLYYKQIFSPNILCSGKLSESHFTGDPISISWPIACGCSIYEHPIHHHKHRRSLIDTSTRIPGLRALDWHLTSGEISELPHVRKRRGIFFGSISAIEGTPGATPILPSSVLTSVKVSTLLLTSVVADILTVQLSINTSVSQSSLSSTETQTSAIFLATESLSVGLASHSVMPSLPSSSSPPSLSQFDFMSSPSAYSSPSSVHSSSSLNQSSTDIINASFSTVVPLVSASMQKPSYYASSEHSLPLSHTSYIIPRTFATQRLTSFPSSPYSTIVAPDLLSTAQTKPSNVTITSLLKDNFTLVKQSSTGPLMTNISVYSITYSSFVERTLNLLSRKSSLLATHISSLTVLTTETVSPTTGNTLSLASSQATYTEQSSSLSTLMTQISRTEISPIARSESIFSASVNISNDSTMYLHSSMIPHLVPSHTSLMPNYSVFPSFLASSHGTNITSAVGTQSLMVSSERSFLILNASSFSIASSSRFTFSKTEAASVLSSGNITISSVKLSSTIITSSPLDTLSSLVQPSTFASIFLLSTESPLSFGVRKSTPRSETSSYFPLQRSVVGQNSSSLQRTTAHGSFINSTLMSLSTTTLISPTTNMSSSLLTSPRFYSIYSVTGNTSVVFNTSVGEFRSTTSFSGLPLSSPFSVTSSELIDSVRATLPTQNMSRTTESIISFMSSGPAVLLSTSVKTPGVSTSIVNMTSVTSIDRTTAILISEISHTRFSLATFIKSSIPASVITLESKLSVSSNETKSLPLSSEVKTKSMSLLLSSVVEPTSPLSLSKTLLSALSASDSVSTSLLQTIPSTTSFLMSEAKLVSTSSITTPPSFVVGSMVSLTPSKTRSSSFLSVNEGTYLASNSASSLPFILQPSKSSELSTATTLAVSQLVSDSVLTSPLMTVASRSQPSLLSYDTSRPVLTSFHSSVIAMTSTVTTTLQVTESPASINFTSTPMYDLNSSEITMPVHMSTTALHVAESLRPETSTRAYRMNSSKPVSSSSQFIASTQSLLTSPLIPSVSPVPDSSPELVNSLGTLTAKVGRVFSYKVPIDTFFDNQDGNTSNLILRCLTTSGNELSSFFWLQYNNKTQTFSGLPMIQDYQNQVSSGLQLILVAFDKAGNTARDIFYVVITSPIVSVLFSITATIRRNYSDFALDSSLKIALANRIAAFYKDTAVNILVTSVRQGSVLFSWSNSSLDSSTCNSSVVNEITRKVQLSNGVLTSDFTQALLPEFPLTGISVQSLGACAPNATEGPITPGLPSQRTSTDTFIRYALPILVVALVAAVIIVLLILNLKRRRRKPPAKDALTFKKGRPVLLPEEYEMKYFPKPPVVLVEDDIVEKEPAVKFPNIYDEPYDDKGGLINDYEEPFLPSWMPAPPPYRSQASSRASSRPSPSYHRPPPTYSLPPPYTPPESMTSQV